MPIRNASHHVGEETFEVILILCLAFSVSGFLLLSERVKTAMFVAFSVVLGCFAFRYWIAGEDLRVVASDVLFCALLLPVGWLTAKSFVSLERS